MLLSRAGFKVDLREDAPSCMFDMGYGCDIMVDWARDAAAPCVWNHRAMADGSYKGRTRLMADASRAAGVRLAFADFSE